jgi:NAD(P)-dependent dehydrogenase (short-subunit alcohol dehydrogenase family)
MMVQREEKVGNTTTRSGGRSSTTHEEEVALIVGGGPGVSASCARRFAAEGMKVAVAARNPEKPVLAKLASEHGVRCYRCDASEPDSVAALFRALSGDLGRPNLVVHNIDGRAGDVFWTGITEAAPRFVLDTLQNSAFSAFLVGQQAAASMISAPAPVDGHRGTIIFTNASAAFKGYPKSGAFAMACHAKSGLAQSMARELMPEGIHVAHVPIDAAIGVTRDDGTRRHRLAGVTVDDNMADPEHIAETYLHLHRQHRSTWTFEVVLRPWVEKW